MEHHFEVIERLHRELSRVIRGKEEFLDLFLTCFFAGGHLLIEDLPGLGKTTAAKALAALIGSSDPRPTLFRRIQFTPDLLPYDITGVDVFHPDRRAFAFQPGPVFTHILLADEINRATPKVQSALLEVMAEQQVTIGNRTYGMDPLFFVVATQNPVEFEGTYNLPLAQLDRFLMQLEIGIPAPEEERGILTDDPSHKVLPLLEATVSRQEVVAAQEAAGSVYCREELIDGVVDMANRIRKDERVIYGVSPRGTLMLLASARARALLARREYVTDQDVLAVAQPVLRHRVVARDRETVRAVIEEAGRGALGDLHR
ncbi:MAG: AAA family ATPase [Alkalispirochaetaceae bacterium]